MAEYHSSPPLDYNTILEWFAKAKSPLRYVDTFLPPEQFERVVSGSATITAESKKIKLTTGTTSGSYAYIISKNLGFGDSNTWDKKRIMQTFVSITQNTNQKVWITTGAGSYHVGFKVVDDVLYGTVAGGGTETATQIATIGSPALLKLLAILYPGQKAEFYLDDELKATITENLPTGSINAEYLFYGSIENTAAENKELYIYWIKVVQFE